MGVPKQLQKHLDESNAEYDVAEHRTVFTAYDLAQTLRRDLADIAKTLLIKTEEGLKLVVVPASKRLNLVKLKKALGVKKLSIASEKDMQKAYGVKPGAIHAFGSVLKGTPVVVDRALAKAKELVFPTGSFTDSLRMKAKIYLSLENPVIASFTDAAKLKLTAKSAADRAKGKKKHKKGKGPRKAGTVSRKKSASKSGKAGSGSAGKKSVTKVTKRKTRKR
ncbi:MAG: YbaK/EbsC family protein [Patescibacteria group bacterium]|jgi:Ala-tRNA(Pro) deacylase